MKKFNLKLVTIFLATLVLLIFFNFIGWLRPFEKGLYFVVNPLTVKLYSWSAQLSNFYENHFGREDLSVKNDILEKKVEELTVANAEFLKTNEENLKLRQNLNFFKANEERKYVLANVLAKEIFSGTDGARKDLTIDKGLSDGLSSGLVVLNEQGIVVGKISDCKEKVCRFVLTTDSSCKLAASLFNENRTSGVTSGNLGLTISMNFMPQIEAVNVGDLVVTSGLEANIPRDLVIGRVTRVDKTSNEMWQAVDIEPAAELNNLTIVSVLIP